MIHLYITSYHNGDKKGLYYITYNQDLNQLGSLHFTPTTDFPSYAIKENNLLYVSMKDASIEKNKGGIQVYSILNGQLSLINTYCGNGTSYTHLTTKDSLLIGANFHGGSIDTFDLDTLQLKQRIEIEGSAIHYVGTMNENCYATDLSLNKVYTLDITNNQLENLQSTLIHDNKGPRHLYIDTPTNIIYLINEGANCVQVYKVDHNQLHLIQEINCLQPNIISDAAAIKISPCKNYLFVSHRGADCISVFKILSDGKLELLYNHPCGKIPRDLHVTDQYIFVACQESSSIEIYQYNETQLNKINEFAVPNPVCIIG